MQDCHFDSGLSAWNFRDKMLRWFFHGEPFLLSEGPAHPICRYRSVCCPPLDHYRVPDQPSGFMDETNYESCRVSSFWGVSSNGGTLTALTNG
jgi:hypothetical protein